MEKDVTVLEYMVLGFCGFLTQAYTTCTRRNKETTNNTMGCEKFHQLGLLAVGRWFPPGTPVSSTRKLISSSFHCLDMTLAVAEALNPNKPNQTRWVYVITFINASSSTDY